MADSTLDRFTGRTTAVHFRVAEGTIAGRAGSDLICDSCMKRNVAPGTLRSAMGFCAECGFPLFYSRRIRIGECDRGAVDRAVAHRLPGVKGFDSDDAAVCPECGEKNPVPSEDDKLTATCYRDGALLYAARPAPVIAEIADPQPTTALAYAAAVSATARRRRWSTLLWTFLVIDVVLIAAIVAVVWLT